MPPPSPVHLCPSEELLTGGDRKPKSGPFTTPPNCASPSSTAVTPPPENSSREQPNLSDCHCCGHRINHANPKNRLQPLDSVWRIVLLCRKCRKDVRSGQTCPYCFKLTGNSGDFVKCSVCKSRIHEGCVRDYGNCTPWCYLGVGLGEFRTCMDCWVPDLLKNSIRVCGRSENNGISQLDNGDAKDCLDKVVKNEKLKAEKKVKMAAMAKEQELRKAIAAKKVSGNQNVENSNSSNAIEISDTELAIQFRRVFDSTPRISPSEFFLNPSNLSIWKIQNWSGISYKRSGLGRQCSKSEKMYSSRMENDEIEWTRENGSSIDANRFELGLSTYKRDKKRKIWKIDDANLTVFESRSSHPEEKFELHSDDARTSWSTDGSDALLCADANESGSLTDVNADQTSSCIGLDRFGQRLAIYKRTRFKKGQVNGMAYVSDKRNMTHFMVSCEAEESLPNGSCNADQDRCHLKYCKKVAANKSYLSRIHPNTVWCENQFSEPALNNSETDSSLKCDGELRAPTESSDADRYFFKYVRKGSKCGSNAETKLRSDSIQHQN